MRSRRRRETLSSDLRRSSEQQLSGQQNKRTERGVVVVRECEKEQEVRTGLCALNTEAENRGRDVGCAGEPAQLSREAVAVLGHELVMMTSKLPPSPLNERRVGLLHYFTTPATPTNLLLLLHYVS